MKKIFFLLYIVFVVSGCTSLLPSAKQTILSPWQSFDEAKTAFDKIIPYKTTGEELKWLGFDPFLTPNIKILTYLDIASTTAFINRQNMDEGLLACVEAKTDCHAYEFESKFIAKKRYGNFWLDFLNFRRQTRETGWKFKALIVTINGTVVYKLWAGNPLIDEKTDTKNPLGPLQDTGDMILKGLL